jgi:type II secretory pathway pseudopilin PulG
MGSLRVARGSTLIAVLLTMTIILILGMAFLSQKSSQYESAVRNREAFQAHALAQAGLVDFRQKMAKDRSFPPKRPEGSDQYQYTEFLTDLADEPYGGYKITVDTSKNIRPYWVIRVTSFGFLGSAETPRSQASIYAEMDAAVQDRSDPGELNPGYREWLIYQNGSGPINASP